MFRDIFGHLIFAPKTQKNRHVCADFFAVHLYCTRNMSLVHDLDDLLEFLQEGFEPSKFL